MTLTDTGMNEATTDPLITAIDAQWQAAGLDSGVLAELRSGGLAAFRRQGFPGTRLENWKYTDTSGIAAAFPGALAAASATGDARAPQAAGALAIDHAITLVFVDGIYRPELSQTDGLPAGVTLGSIADLLRTDADRLTPLLGSLAPAEDSGFIALNTAFAGQGAALLIDSGVTLDRPVYIRHLGSAIGVAAQPRLLVSLENGAVATVVEHFASAGEMICNPLAEMFCGDNARLTYYKLQDEATAALHTAAQYATVGRAASLTTTAVDIGGALARNDLKVFLRGRGAHAESRGLFMADGKRHVESRIDINHCAPDTTSRERYRGILAGRARGVFNGRIHVHQVAQKTAAELTNRNLLLSKGAEINTKPELEIYADDVKCAHGSTTGQLDANSLFYLLTRGVDRRIARNMLITAFVAELLTDISVPAIAQRAVQALEALQDGAQ